ncbi:MAG: DUF2853 family protein, partial [Polymorphobacter sp.]
KHCGIALRNRDSSLVSFSDAAETDRVRESWCKKKLGLTDADSVLDAAIAKVGERMKADRTKNRVTVYYLVAEAFGKLGMFGAVTAAAAGAVAAAPVMAAVAAPVAPVATPVPPVATPVAAPPRAAPLAAVPEVAEAGGSMRWLWILLGLLAAAALIWWLMRGKAEPAAPAVTTEAVAPEVALPAAAPAVVAPEGAGVTSQEVAGKPALSVYFDTAKTDVAPDFAAAAAMVKAYLESHPGARLAVSGYNDPRGDAAMNAELAKNRAKNVRVALVLIGVPETSIDLVKPVETTDTDDTMVQARRVDISVVDPS